MLKTISPKSITRRTTLAVTLGLTAALFATSALPTMAQDAKTVTLGYAPWSDAEFVTKLAAKVIEDKLGQKVELLTVRPSGRACPR